MRIHFSGSLIVGFAFASRWRDEGINVRNNPGRQVAQALRGALALSIVASAAFAADPAPASVPAPPTGVSCVWLPGLRSQYYSVIDNQHLVIEGTGRTYYLLTLTRRCFDLDTTLDIGLSAHGDQLCTGDAIVIDRDRCTIQSVESVPSEAQAKALVKARTDAEKAKRKSDN